MKQTQLKAFYIELAQLMDKHGHDLTAPEMLALASNLVGKLIAMQDQQIVSPQAALDLVWNNIQQGNIEVVTSLANTKGTMN